jgi:transposase-like protein
MPTLRGFDEEFGQDAVATTFRRGSPMRKQPAQIVTNKRSPVVHVSTEVPRPLGEAFEEIARANGITKAELLRRLIQTLVEARGQSGCESDLNRATSTIFIAKCKASSGR